MKITDSIKYIGVDDHKIDLFEGQFEVPLGMAYNSYIITDEKTAVMDSVDQNFGDEWLKNIEKALAGRSPDYLIVQHMEMDHSANIKKFAEKYPSAKIAASKTAFTMMKSYFGTDFSERQLVLTEGAAIELGKNEGDHSLTFISAPNVHWPEVIFTYDKKEKVLFSADAFGKFGANDKEDPEGWACEARRYYFGIVGKFGTAVQTVLKKAAALDIKTIAPLHGPVLTDDIAYYLKTYDTWSSYGVESEGVCVLYTSVYGNTKKAAEKLSDILKAKGCPKVALADLAREDTYECVEDAFRYGKLILATTTYNGGVFPKMREFIDHLKERNYQNRKIGFIENGSWAPLAAKGMLSMFEGSTNLTFCQTKVTIKIALTDENNSQLEKLADEILE
jgi:flavorubredoxin